VLGSGADIAERDDAYAVVRAAFEEHSVLLFSQPITDSSRSRFPASGAGIARSRRWARARHSAF
jgi:hypothetical protein